MIAALIAPVLLVTVVQATSQDSADAAVSIPTGFTPVPIPTGQPEGNLTNFEFLPDDRVLTLGRDGQVTVVSNDAPPRTVTTIPNAAHTGDLGALGLTLAPDYATTGKLYVLYARDTADGRVLRVSRWTAEPAADPTSLTGEEVLLETPLLTSIYHGGGTVLVAPDGKLLVSIGDNAAPMTSANPEAMRAQNLDVPFGKVLRIDPATGAGVAGNPYFNAASPSSWRSKVYAYGLRNPFRMSVDPTNGRVIVGDVGWSSYEELNSLTAGANYGWPCYEGVAKQAKYSATAACGPIYTQSVTAPLYYYSRAGIQGSITGGTWYTGTSYPAAYQGAYFFSDYSQQKLWTMMIDAQGKVTRAPETSGFATGIGGPVAMKTGPNGDIYFADIISGNLIRLRYSAGNRAPIAQAATTVDPATLTVSFDASTSYDLDGDNLTYAWDFGDGSQGTGAVVTHTYAAAGKVTAKLTVTDSLGLTATKDIVVVPNNHPPDLTLNGPDKKYAVGDTVSLSASATDAEDGPLQVSWRTDLIHCAPDGGCHQHPGQTSTGATYSDLFDDHGDMTTMQVTAWATDSDGTVTQQVYKAEPDLRTLTVVAPVPVLINGDQRVSVKVTVGSHNELAPPAMSGTQVFTNWSDGGMRTRSLTMPASDVILTANYAKFVPGRYADYNGDGRTDLQVFQPGTTTWLDRNFHTLQHGAATDIQVPADINSDGRTDIVSWRPSDGVWRARGFAEAQWGANGDMPVPGDYSVDGRTDLAVWRPSTGDWLVRNVMTVRWGQKGDIPVPGDYNGDGKLETAVFRPSTGMWWIRGKSAIHWGEPGDIPVAGDFIGDKKTELAIWRPATGTWWINGRTAQRWGETGDIPLTGDFTGDGKTDLAIWRPSTATWWINGQPAVQWGTPTDKPIPRPLGSLK
ncbi:glucose/arabinose dehydrogenase [Kribbella antiqua]|uniref:Glucose/arabinose dehydrogenase n=2 Tax=Kribbella antiqua TaxID=2512217 RepID=A0A4V2S4S1_9ACTN|nr:glucose/arabinose dehydrogenase [Kribbella antiqua]